jgi:DNA-binding beta-propeller fold protein YncE
VSLPSYVPDPVLNPTVVVPSVVAINTQSNQLLLPPMTVGNNPVALAVTPDKSKLYVANEGDSTLSAFNTVDRSNRGVQPANTSSPPIWLVARSDNQRVYVLEETTGVLASIDTTATAGPDPLTEYPGISVPGATTMVYDSNKNRLYIPGGPVMAIVDVSQSSPRLMATITIPNVPAIPNSVPASAVAAAALPDASRAYVASIPNVALSSQATVSAVQGDGTNATFTYTWTGGHDLAPGILVTVSGISSPNDVFNGTYTIIATSGTSCDQPTQVCTFLAANPTVLSTKATVTGSVASTGDNLFPQITVVDVPSNTITSSFNTSGFPDATVAGTPYYAPICATTRFRFMMAAGGDSTRTYLSSCDGGNVNIIDTAANKYVLNLAAPIGARTPIPPSVLNPPQNPVFLIAGP